MRLVRLLSLESLESSASGWALALAITATALVACAGHSDGGGPTGAALPGSGAGAPSDGTSNEGGAANGGAIGPGDTSGAGSPAAGSTSSGGSGPGAAGGGANSSGASSSGAGVANGSSSGAGVANGSSSGSGVANGSSSGSGVANGSSSGSDGGARVDGGKGNGGLPDAGRPASFDGSTAMFTVYIAGDSTVSQYVLDPANPKSWAGWGQMVQPHYDSRFVTVLDKAVGGMTARHFILAGDLAAILNVLKPGDYLLVQFGTNDSNTGAMFTIGGATYPYFADAATDFKTYLQQYIDGARAKGAIPVLVTAPPRNSAYCGGARSLANYGQAMIELGAADQVAVVDLGLKTWTYLNKICPKPADGTTEMFFKVTGTAIDGTHFQENGARIMAGFVADGVGEAGLGLGAFRIN